jgi:lipopolysaccharide export system protein LptA
LTALVAGPLAFALAHGVAHAQDFESIAGTRSTHAGRVDLSGNEFVYDAHSDTFIARGDARLRQGPTLLQADVMRFNRKEQRLMAQGNVNLTDPEVDVTASRADVDVNDETGVLQNAKVTVKRSDYYLAGRRITKFLGQHYRVIDGYFTTCGCESGTPSWSIAGKEIDAVLGGKGTVKDAHLQVLGHTVMDLPYAVFPADTDRQSGFLSPTIGQSHLRGFQYFQPYFIDIDRSQDATVALDVETLARIGGMAEYRLQNGSDDYLRVTGGFFNESIRSESNAVVVDNQIADTNVPVDRYGLIGMLRQHLDPDLVVYADGIMASDSVYWRDMDVYTLSRGYGTNFGLLRTGNSDFGIQQSFENSYLLLDGMWIQDYIQAQQFALQKMPELVWSGRQNLGFGSSYVDYDFQAVNYLRENGIDGGRFDAHPDFTMPFHLKDYLYGWGTLGLEETAYDVSGHDITIFPVGTYDPVTDQVLNYNNQLGENPALAPGGFLHRELITGEFAVGSRLERIYNVNWHKLKKLKHTIEPLVQYNYVPVVDQGQLPIFDETDRVEPRSMISYGVVSRLYGKFSGSEDVSSASNGDTAASESGEQPTGNVQQPATYHSGQGSTTELAEFSLLHEYDILHALAPAGEHFSDIDASMVVYPTRYLSLGTETDFNPSTRQFAGETLFFAIRPPWVESQPIQQTHLGRAYTGGSYFQINYAYVSGSSAVEQISGRAYYEFFNRIGLYYEPSYDIADGKMLYSEYGLRLKSKCDCWILDLGINDSINPSEVQIFAQLTLGGLGSIGHNPFGRSMLLNNQYGANHGFFD